MALNVSSHKVKSLQNASDEKKMGLTLSQKSPIRMLFEGFGNSRRELSMLEEP